VSVIVDKFKDVTGAVVKARADLNPDVPDQIIDFADVFPGGGRVQGSALSVRRAVGLP